MMIEKNAGNPLCHIVFRFFTTSCHFLPPFATRDNKGFCRNPATTERYTKALMQGKRKLINSFEIGDEKNEKIIEMKVKKRG